MTKTSLLLLAVAVQTLAAGPDTGERLAPACGPNDQAFTVTTSKSASKPASTDTNSALVYIIQDDSMYQSVPRPTIRTGIDGEWVGATHANSYAAFPVAPGEHHFCFAWQSKVALTFKISSIAAARTIRVNPGQVLYLRVRDVFLDVPQGQMRQPPQVVVDVIDSDEGQLLTNRFSQSVSHLRK